MDDEKLKIYYDEQEGFGRAFARLEGMEATDNPIIPKDAKVKVKDSEVVIEGTTKFGGFGVPAKLVFKESDVELVEL